MPTATTVRVGTDDDFPAVRGLFDAALLEVDPDRLRSLLADGTSVDTDEVETSDDDVSGFVLLATPAVRGTDDRSAVAQSTPSGSISARSTSTRPGGAIAVDTAFDRNPAHRRAHVVAIAVRPQRRGRGIGRTLIERAADRVAPRPLSARFDPRVRPFYAACGFDIEPRDGRLWGVRDATAVNRDDADANAANSADADRDAANSADASSVDADRDADDAADTVEGRR